MPACFPVLLVRHRQGKIAISKRHEVLGTFQQEEFNLWGCLLFSDLQPDSTPIFFWLSRVWSVGHFNKTAFNSESPKLGESQGLGESLRLSPILGESLKLSPKIGESFRGELFNKKELWHFFTYVQNSPLN